VNSPALALAMLSTVPFIMVLGNSMLIPVLPQIKEALHLTSVQVNLLITLFSIPAGLVIPVAGILADRFGRKAVIIPGLLLYGAGGVVAGLAATLAAQPYPWIVAGRILQGLGAAGTAPIAMALTGDLFSRRERSRALGVLEAANGIGKVLSPIFGSLLALLAWYALFFAFPALCIPAALGIALWVRETHKRGDAPSLSRYKRDLARMWKRQRSWLPVAFLAGAVTLFTLFGTLVYLSDILEDRYRIDGVKKGFVLAIPLLAMSATAYGTGVFLQRRARYLKRLIVAGLLLLGAATALAPFMESRFGLVTVLSVGAVGAGLVLPGLNLLITSAVGPQERGLVTALYGSVRFLGVAVGPPLFGALLKWKILLFGMVAVLVLFIGFLALRRIGHATRLRGHNGEMRTLLRKPAPVLHK
jgi:Arabinose efflux permease